MRDGIIGSVSASGLSREGGTAPALGDGAPQSGAATGPFSGKMGDDAPTPRRGEAPAREDGGGHGIGTDIRIRLLGLAAVALAGAIIRWLHADIRQHPGAEASAWQLALVAVAFLGASIGCGLAGLGRHVHDRIELSERWRRRL